MPLRCPDDGTAASAAEMMPSLLHVIVHMCGLATHTLVTRGLHSPTGTTSLLPQASRTQRSAFCHVHCLCPAVVLLLHHDVAKCMLSSRPKDAQSFKSPDMCKLDEIISVLRSCWACYCTTHCNVPAATRCHTICTSTGTFWFPTWNLDAITVSRTHVPDQ